MTPAEARAAVVGHFVTQWANRTPIDHDEDARATPTPPFVRVALQHNGALPQSWTGPVVHWSRFGVVSVQAIVPGGRGTADVDALAAAAVQILEGRKFAGGLRLGAAVVQDAGRDDYGNRLTVVSVSFEYTDSHA
jgi:hypothetical protein